MTDEPEKIELMPDSIKVQSGEVITSSGEVTNVIWIEAEGRRMHTPDRVQIFMFFLPDEAVEHAVTVIKETAILDLSLTLTQGDPDGPSDPSQAQP